MEKIMDLQFILTQSVVVLTLVLVQYCNGLLVTYKEVKVNYTRKINHFLLFFVPILLNQGYAHDYEFGLYALGAFLAVAKFVFYTRPVRDRVTIIRMMFRSFDRPEDRPYTLLWIVTQTAAGYLVLIPMGMLFSYYQLYHLLMIPVLIYGIGDGLAEPVGVKFGRHKYQTYALFTRNKYTRSLEGSFVVFITSVAVITFYYFSAGFTTAQFVIALLVVPILMTLAEAFSPHTWDSPIMFLVGYIVIFSIAFV